MEIIAGPSSRNLREHRENFVCGQSNRVVFLDFHARLRRALPYYIQDHRRRRRSGIEEVAGHLIVAISCGVMAILVGRGSREELVEVRLKEEGWKEGSRCRIHFELIL